MACTNITTSTFYRHDYHHKHHPCINLPQPDHRGKDVKSNLFDNYDWLNKDFHKAKSAGSKNASQYNILEESW